MRLLALLANVLVWVLITMTPAQAQAPDPAPFDRLLQRYVSTGTDGVNRVDYRAWRSSPADRAALDAFIAAHEAARPSQLARQAQFAFWANLYNAVTLDVVLEAYPVSSIRQIRPTILATGPWRMERVTVEGRALSLDDIEHRIMRPIFRDPRVHYAVNCASIGCPNLQREAFRGAQLDAQLDAAARAFIASDRGVRITSQGLRLSRIYQWFAEDFGSEERLRDHLARYAADAKQLDIRRQRISGYDYNWELNDAR